jgi:formylmethanofuran dehydrogenase subunit E
MAHLLESPSISAKRSEPMTELGMTKCGRCGEAFNATYEEEHVIDLCPKCLDQLKGLEDTEELEEP